MNSHHNEHDKKNPLHIHLGDDDDELDTEERNTDEHDVDEYDDDEVEVIRPQGPRKTTSQTPSPQLETTDEDEELPPSKTQIKKQMHELRDLGKELTELSKDQLAQLDIPDNLRDAIREMKSIKKFGAQRRQIQYIGKLMRGVDSAPIFAKLDIWKGKSIGHIAHGHHLERWRDRLMESDSTLTQLLAEYPGADAQRLRSLMRNAHKEISLGKPPKNFRGLYQALKEIIPEPK
ncbi:MAG: ribosome biogenesis factor YjgA [Gallionella sp.]